MSGKLFNCIPHVAVPVSPTMMLGYLSYSMRAGPVTRYLYEFNSYKVYGKVGGRGALILFSPSPYQFD